MKQQEVNFYKWICLSPERKAKSTQLFNDCLNTGFELKDVVDAYNSYIDELKKQYKELIDSQLTMLCEEVKTKKFKRRK